MLFPTDNCGSVVAGAFLARRSPPAMVTPLPRAATQSGARPQAHICKAQSLTVSRYAFGIAPCICTLVGTLIHNYQLERALVSRHISNVGQRRFNLTRASFIAIAPGVFAPATGALTHREVSTSLEVCRIQRFRQNRVYVIGGRLADVLEVSRGLGDAHGTPIADPGGPGAVWPGCGRRGGRAVLEMAPRQAGAVPVEIGRDGVQADRYGSLK